MCWVDAKDVLPVASYMLAGREAARAQERVDGQSKAGRAHERVDGQSKADRAQHGQPKAI